MLNRLVEHFAGRRAERVAAAAESREWRARQLALIDAHIRRHEAQAAFFDAKARKDCREIHTTAAALELATRRVLELER